MAKLDKTDRINKLRGQLMRGADKVRYRKGLRYVVPLAKALVGYRGSRKSHLLEAEFLGLGSHRDFVVGEGVDGAHYVIMTSDQSVGRFIYAWGSYERNQLRRAVERGAIAPGSLMLDVGANLGTASISGLVSGWFDRAIAIEADPENARLIRTNVALNNLDEKMSVISAAAGRAAGTVSFAVDTMRRGNSKVSSDGQGISVPVVSLAGVLADRGIDPGEVGLVWVDVEGFEAEVIAGAGELWEKASWVLELRSETADLQEIGRLLKGRRVLVLTEHERPADRKLSTAEIEAMATGRAGEIGYDVLVLPLGS